MHNRIVVRVVSPGEKDASSGEGVSPLMHQAKEKLKEEKWKGNRVLRIFMEVDDSPQLRRVKGR